MAKRDGTPTTYVAAPVLRAHRYRMRADDLRPTTLKRAIATANAYRRDGLAVVVREHQNNGCGQLVVGRRELDEVTG